MNRMSKIFRSALLFFVILFTASLFSCKDFFGTEDLKDSIREEVETATAPEVSVTLQAEKDSMGVPNPYGPQTFKVGLSYGISTTVGGDYTFLEWTHNGDEADDISFVNPLSPSTSMVINHEKAGLEIIPTFDRRPYVFSKSPGSETTGVYVNSAINIKFSESIDPSSVVIGDTVDIVTWPAADFSAVPTSINSYFSVTVNDSAVTLNLINGNTYSKNYTVMVTLAEGILDLNGNSMGEDYYWQFTTGLSSDVTPPAINSFSVTNVAGIESVAAQATAFTNSTDITLNIDANDDTQDVTGLQIIESYPCNSDGSLQIDSLVVEHSKTGYDNHYSFTLTMPSEGYTKIQIKVADALGNWTTLTGGVSDTKVIGMDFMEPTNQNSIFRSSVSKKGGDPVTIYSSVSQGGESGDSVWFAPLGTVTFTANDSTITKATGSATSIAAPANEGSYRLYVLDAAGNESSPSAYILTVDNTPPSNQDTVFSSSTEKKGTDTVTIVSSGNSTNSVWFAPAGTTSFVSNGTTITTAGGTATSIAVPDNEGEYRLYVLDAVGNASSASTAILTVDNTPPTSQNTVFPTSVSKKGSATVTIVSSGDSTNSVWFAPSGTITFVSNGTTITTAGGTATSITAPSSGGSYKMFVLDAVGNYSAASTATLTVDNTPPTNQDTVFPASVSKKGTDTVTIVSSGDSTNSVWFAPAGTTDFSAANGTTITTAGGTATSIAVPDDEGDYKLYVVDAVGNYSSASSATLTVDNTVPTNQDTVFASSLSKKGGAAVTIVSAAETGGAVWFAPFGTTTFTAGDTMTTAGGTVTSILAPNNAGSYRLFVVDAAGNRSSASTAILTVDNTAPTNQNSVFPSSVTKKGTDTVTIVSSGDSTNSVWFAPAGTTDFSAANGTTKTTAGGTATTIDAPDTAGDYKLFVVDAAGNYSSASSATLTIDNTAPTNQNTVFASSVSKKGGATVSIVSAAETGGAVWFAPSGTTTFTSGSTMTTAGGTATSILAPADAGSYKLYVIDAAGNRSDASSATLTVDNTVPTNQDTVFTASVSKKGGAAVTIVSAAETGGAVWFAPSGTTTFTSGSNMTTAGGTALSITAPTDAGFYKLYVIDAAGNRSDASSATLTVDNTAPTNQDTVFAASVSKKGGAAVTIVSAAETGGAVWFAPSGTTSFTSGSNMTTAGGTATSIPAPADEGSYYLYVVDSAGNVSSASTAVLTVDNTSPSLSNPITTSVTINKNNSTDAIVFTLPEALYSSSAGAALDGTFFTFTDSDTIGVISSAAVTHPSAGDYGKISVVLTWSTAPDANFTVTLSWAAGKTVYDAAGNSASTPVASLRGTALTARTPASFTAETTTTSSAGNQTAPSASGTALGGRSARRTAVSNAGTPSTVAPVTVGSPALTVQAPKAETPVAGSSVTAPASSALPVPEKADKTEGKTLSPAGDDTSAVQASAAAGSSVPIAALRSTGIAYEADALEAEATGSNGPSQGAALLISLAAALAAAGLAFTALRIRRKG